MNALTFAATLTTLAVIGTLAFVGYLIACAATCLYRDISRRWKFRSPIVRVPPQPDGRIYSVGGRGWK